MIHQKTSVIRHLKINELIMNQLRYCNLSRALITSRGVVIQRKKTVVRALRYYIVVLREGLCL